MKWHPPDKDSQAPLSESRRLKMTAKSRIAATPTVRVIGNQAFRLGQSLIRAWQRGAGLTVSGEGKKSTKSGR